MSSDNISEFIQGKAQPQEIDEIRILRDTDLNQRWQKSKKQLRERCLGLGFEI